MLKQSPQKVIILTGPTASGKSQLAEMLFPKYFDLLINADSRQIYRGLNIGTAKPSTQSMAKYAYELIDFLSPNADYSAYQFITEAFSIIKKESQKRICVVGGTPFYIEAIRKGLPSHKKIPVGIRNKLSEIYGLEGLAPLLEELKKKDPEYYEKVDRQNSRRVLRALEVIEATGLPFSGLQNERKATNIFPLIFILFRPREVLYHAIEMRVEKMFDAGWVDEVRSLLKMGVARDSQALSGIGYKEIMMHLQGDCGLDETKKIIAKKTRHFAKQQMTWFKRFSNCIHFSPDPNEKCGEHDAWYDNLPVVDIDFLVKNSFNQQELPGAYRLKTLSELKKSVELFYEN